MTIPDNSTKAAAIKLLERGEITLSEAARLAGTSKQAAQQWARGRELDLNAARERHLARIWTKALKSR